MSFSKGTSALISLRTIDCPINTSSCPRSTLMVLKFFTYSCHCSVDTELIDRNYDAKKMFQLLDNLQWSVLTVFHVLCFWTCAWTMESLHGKIGCPLSANSNSISSAILSQAPCGLFSAEYHFLSEPGPINDHCPTPILLATTLTTLAFATHSSSLPLPSQEMSLNIDINRILPVKVSGSSPKLLSRSVTLPQSCIVVNPGKMFHSNSVGLSIDSVIVSVAFLGLDPYNSVLPSFVGICMLKDPPEAQHRIWEDVDFCALKIDNGFITNQWQLFPWMIFSNKFLSKLFSSCSLTNFSEMSNIFFKVRSVELLMEFSWSMKFFPMNVAAFIVAAINIYQIIKCSSPESATFDIIFCLFRTWSFTLFTNFAASLPHDETFGICLFLVIQFLTFPRSIMNHLSVPYRMRISRSRRGSSRWGANFLHHIPRSFLRFPLIGSCAVTSLFHS